MSLSKIELQAGIEKLRLEYRELGREFGEDFFSLKEFNRRYTHSEVHGINLQAFLLSELSFLEELKNKYDTLYEKKLRASKQFDKIAGENLKKWQAFPRINIHFNADEELCYFYGAMSFFYYSYTPVFYFIFGGSEQYFQIQKIIINMEKIALFRKGGFSAFIEQYKKILESNPEKSEKVKQDILKDSALLLKECYTFAENYIHNPENENYLEQKLNESISWDNTTFIQEEIRELKNLNNLQALQRSISRALEILSAFSLKAFI